MHKINNNDIVLQRGINMNDIIHISTVFDEMITDLKFIKLLTYNLKKD